MIKLFILLLTLQATLYAIVNTEPLPAITKQGFSQQLNINGHFYSGNNNYLALNPTYTLSYQATTTANLKTFLISDIAYAKSEQTIIKNSSFMMLRFVNNISTTKSIEPFIQNSSNSFLDLKQRFLTGIVLRNQLFYTSTLTLHTTIGLLAEYENITNQAATTISRASLCTILDKKIYQSNHLYTIIYIQPKLDEFNDLRLMLQLRLTQPLTDYISTQTALKITFDNQPPNGLNKTDSYITQSLQLNF